MNSKCENNSLKPIRHDINDNSVSKESSSRSINSNKSKIKKKVTFNSDFAKIIDVESWKQYNLELSADDPTMSGDKEVTKCACLII